MNHTEKIRIVKSIHRDWTFRYYPQQEGEEEGVAGQELWPQAFSPDYADSHWQPVALPHTWSTYETTGELHPFILSPSEKDDPFWWHGWGWYRKRFRLGPAHRDKKCFVEFDGVMKYCRIWLNGKYIGEHKGGYASFSFDLTEALRFTDDNVMAVAVSNRRNDRFGGIPPMTAGNFNVYGGIYRNVRLVLTDKLHIPFQGSSHHEGGTYVTTPQVSEDAAVVRVKTYVRNSYAISQCCVLNTAILDGGGRTVAEMQSRQVVAPGELVEFDQTSGEVAKPLLWSPETPNIYTVVSEVAVDGPDGPDGSGEPGGPDGHDEPDRTDGPHGRVVDRYISPFGIRFFHWDRKSNRLSLNGRLIHIHGTNRHQEFPWLGDAIPDWVHESDLRDIKDNLGHNFIRTCHYTQDKAVYDLCDRLGILVCEEVPNIKSLAFGEDVQRQQVIEMIRRDRNHPCIIMWSMGNETNRPANGEWALEEDSGRIIHYRHVKGTHPHMQHTHEQMDMENLLRCTIRGWYNRDVKLLEPAIGQHAGHEEWQHEQAVVEGGSQRGRIDMNGVMWLYADHGADREYVNSPLKHFNPKGWVDAYRVPKLMYYLWQAHWLDRPMAYIHPYDWTERYLRRSRNIKVNSNCDWVELKINGRAVGRRFPSRDNDFTVVFTDVLVERGTLSVEGVKGELEAAHSVTLAGAPARLSVSARHKVITADRAGITLIDVDIVDSDGVHVYGATNELRFTVTGPGRLVGPNAILSDIDRCEEMAGTMYIDAPISMPIRSTAEAGAITVTVASPGLESASVSIDSVYNEEPASTGIHEPQVGDRSGQCAVEKVLRTRTSSEVRSFVAGFLRETFEDLDFSSLTEAQYESALDSWIKKWNDDTSFDPSGYPLLKLVLLEHLQEDGGIVVADDYNMHIAHYNLFMQMAVKLDVFEASGEAKRLNRQTLAERIIMEGVELGEADLE
jgi:hypothetical protein